MNKVFLMIFFKVLIKSIIQDAVYSFIYKNLYLNYENETLQLSESVKEQINLNFRIKKISSNLNNTFYHIEHINSNLNIIYLQNNILNVQLRLIDGKEEEAKWNFIEIDNNNYIIQNKEKCYIKIIKLNIVCEYINLDEGSQFTLIKIYEEVKESKLDNDIIEKEQIDVLIKYIDLRDKNLVRNKIHQIKKDYENEELRYSIRSILKNIPWIRKIFILMPNENVRYFKNYQLIKDKIIYVKDRELLGFDSANSLAFQFMYWKMEKFGISNNFIAMDDDCFIGLPLTNQIFFMFKMEKLHPQ